MCENKTFQSNRKFHITTSNHILDFEVKELCLWFKKKKYIYTIVLLITLILPCSTYGNGMVLHFYQQQESSTTKTVHKVIKKGLKAYV